MIKTSPFEENGLPFWVPNILLQLSKVVLWNLFSVQMIFWWMCGGESDLPVLFLHPLRPPYVFLTWIPVIGLGHTQNIQDEFLSSGPLTQPHLQNLCFQIKPRSQVPRLSIWTHFFWGGGAQFKATAITNHAKRGCFLGRAETEFLKG